MLWQFLCIDVLSMHFNLTPTAPFAYLKYQKQLSIFFQFFCVPKRGPVETISSLLRFIQECINRALEFEVGLTAASPSPLYQDVPAHISSNRIAAMLLKPL